MACPRAANPDETALAEAEELAEGMADDDEELVAPLVPAQVWASAPERWIACNAFAEPLSLQ